MYHEFTNSTFFVGEDTYLIDCIIYSEMVNNSIEPGGCLPELHDITVEEFSCKKYIEREDEFVDIDDDEEIFLIEAGFLESIEGNVIYDWMSKLSH